VHHPPATAAATAGGEGGSWGLEQHYDLLGKIGEGTYGVVYLATAKQDKKQLFAIKKFKTGRVSSHKKQSGLHPAQLTPALPVSYPGHPVGNTRLPVLTWGLFCWHARHEVKQTVCRACYNACTLLASAQNTHAVSLQEGNGLFPTAVSAHRIQAVAMPAHS
jgi:serine/threonine protein kinase